VLNYLGMQAAALATPSIDSVALDVEAHLGMVLERERERWSVVDGRLAEPIDLLADYVLAGGKRLRPVFCCYGFLGAGGNPDARDWLDVAAGLELLHAFALLHDDVMDGSALRRGRPALHRRLEEDHQRAGWRGEPRRFGEGMAVLLGDLAFTCADRLVRRAGSDVGAVWDELRIELMMGQYLDVAGCSRGSLPTEQALLVARYKSGAYSVERPLHLGAAHAGGTLALIDGYTAFGRPLGEAFQLRDDLLGVFGDEASTGKPSGEDLREGKPTVLLALARRLAGPHGSPLLARIGAVDLADDEIDRLRHLLVDCGASAGVERMIAERHARALDALQVMDLPTAVDVRLRELAARAVWRID
jgi:geranylgeranyl diphosphate synthase type I